MKMFTKLLIALAALLLAGCPRHSGHFHSRSGYYDYGVSVNTYRPRARYYREPPVIVERNVYIDRTHRQDRNYYNNDRYDRPRSNKHAKTYRDKRLDRIRRNDRVRHFDAPPSNRQRHYSQNSYRNNRPRPNRRPRYRRYRNQ